MQQQPSPRPDAEAIDLQKYHRLVDKLRKLKARTVRLTDLVLRLTEENERLRSAAAATDMDDDDDEF